MKTPICDFVNAYAERASIRMHMPGHKGLGDVERLDITEVAGADSLYEASGIIAESERYASEIFGAHTFYSTEGSSHAIRAMLYLLRLYAGENCRVLAARNVHKSFVSAAGHLGIEVDWIAPDAGLSYLCSDIDADALRKRFAAGDIPSAVYLTSPDYLGRISRVESIAGVCHEFGVLLLVDNAHGAYLKLLDPSRHPMDLGADMCSDSAHKTLPVLTGGAYLHIAKNAPDMLAREAKRALSVFGSTSPSYLTLASLDRANAYIESGYRERLASFVDKLDAIKMSLSDYGYTLFGDEPLKITVAAKSYGYTGEELSSILERSDIVSEFADRDHLVLMLTPENSEAELFKLTLAFSKIEKRAPLTEAAPVIGLPERRLSIREAMLSASEYVPTETAQGRVLAEASVGCPPAVPIAVSGEVIDDACVRAFEYYGAKRVSVVK